MKKLLLKTFFILVIVLTVSCCQEEESCDIAPSEGIMGCWELEERLVYSQGTFMDSMEFLSEVNLTIDLDSSLFLDDPLSNINSDGEVSNDSQNTYQITFGNSSGNYIYVLTGLHSDTIMLHHIAKSPVDADPDYYDKFIRINQ